MQFEEKFNEVGMFPDYFEEFNDFNKKIETKIRNFNEEYRTFQKTHGLENLYFSKVVHIDTPHEFIIEVYYEIRDLYLSYLEANNRLPDGAIIETLLIKEQYLDNTQKEWNFRDSMFEAIEQQVGSERHGHYTTYHTSMFVGRTERIKLSDPCNGLPGMIIERIPMTYDDMIEKT